MTAHESLGPQFTSYRGILMGKGEAAPSDDSEILERLNPRVNRRDGLTSVNSPYGPHWTDDEPTAHRFARDPQAGGYEKLPPAQRKLANTPGKPWGVVLEANHGPNPIEAEKGKRMYYSEPYSDHEKEVRVWRPEIHSVTAHVFQDRERVRSFDLPEGHWDPDPAYHERAVKRWQKERSK